MPCLQLFYVSVESFFTGSYLQFCTVKVETFFRARVYSYSILVLWAVFTILLNLNFMLSWKDLVTPEMLSCPLCCACIQLPVGVTWLLPAADLWRQIAATMH